MGTLADATALQYTQTTTVTVVGTPLDLSDDHPLAREGLLPILASVCVCVTEPCDCKDGPIVWLPHDDVRARRSIERKNRAGEQLFSYVVDRNASIVVERFLRTTAGGVRKTPAAGPPITHAAGSSYGGQDCGGGTLYDVWVEQDGLETTYYYVAVGSC